MPPRKATSVRQRALAAGYRSGLEERIGEELKEQGYEVAYEGCKIFYTPPVKARSYTPDWPLPNGIVVESKGRFQTEDRQKHRNIKEEHPDIEIRFVFSNAKAKLSKGSKTTYADWCDKYGFQWATGSVPVEWLEEAPSERRINALKAAGIKPPTK